MHLPDHLFQVTAEVGKLLGAEKVDAILCVAGGWAGGNAKSKCESFSELVIFLFSLSRCVWMGLYYLSGQMFSCMSPRSFTVAVR